MILRVLCILLLTIALLFDVNKFVKNRRISTIINSILVVVYLYIVLLITVLRNEHFSSPKKILIPFKSYISLITVQWHGSGMYIAMALWGNLILFIPLGVMVSKIIKRNNILIAVGIGFLCSLMIETYQYFSCVGTFEVDDLIQNTWGACIGCCLENIMGEARNIHMEDNIVKDTSPIVAFAVLFSVCCMISILR